jgi:hypothetical protein
MSVLPLLARRPKGRAFPVERRISPRRPCLREITCQAVTGGKEESAPALLEDVSSGGLRLVLRRCYEAGCTLAVSWRLHPHKPGRTVLAHVVHASSEGGGNWVVGCALASALTEQELSALL